MKKLIPYLFLLTLLASLLPQPAQAQEIIVGLPGTHQDELGCPGDWQPDCAQTLLAYDAEDDLWQATFLIQPGNDGDKKGARYKVALNGSWSENYGQNATPGGADIPLVVSEPTEVTFYYDHKTHWVADNFNTPILVATGDFQTQLGCQANNDPACMRGWLQDPEGDSLFAFSTRALKAGTYSLALQAAGQVVAPEQTFTVLKTGDEIYFGYDAMNQKLTVSATGAPKGNLLKQKAHWVSLNTILTDMPGSSTVQYELYYAEDVSLALTSSGVEGGASLPLTYEKRGASKELRQAFPHLASLTALTFNQITPEQARQILRGQLALLARDQAGNVIDVTGVQIPGVLDELYPYTGELGITYANAIPTLRLWAPTAQKVQIHLFDAPDAPATQILPLQREDTTGVWSITGAENWNGAFYRYEVSVYAPSTNALETNLVTDPYSVSLSTNSQYSQIINLQDPSLKPAGWDALAKPSLQAPEDIVLYELHIRDFSATDTTVPAELRGTYAAFTVEDSNGMKHLRALANAGLTHIHLLPAFDIASVNEDKSTWQSLDEAALAALPPNSEQQALAASAINGADGFNWGYDPLHYSAPEGSYSVNPQGSPRTLEFRQMVQALNHSGLRVVMDVVYNHTNASGQAANSVLDKVVPGYYHRLNGEGTVERSTCCDNTASEHAMMQKLMVDSILLWAKEYKVDGFRFDLMGHHMLADMQAVRAGLDSLTLEKDGVDGKAIYIYGEGWDFGEVAKNARGINASQQNIGGSGIGVFNDRLRDGVRGGNPFGDPAEQGFATGLFFSPNPSETRREDAQKRQLFNYTDWIRLGMAGNLKEFQITRATGETIPGERLLYGGAPTGYTLDPQENILYASAHDNETLWDAIQLKAPASATLQDRVRMNNLALSVVAFSQGIPFFHAGDDLLRSKSLDRNSYNSGDWFNRLDWTYESNNWGVGLPPEGRERWESFGSLLANPALRATKAEVTFSAAVFQEYLQIRKSSPLFRLQTAQEIQQSLTFLNTGKDQTPGLIVMRLQDTTGRDPRYAEILVFINAAPQSVSFASADLQAAYSLHPIQQHSADEVVRQAAYDPQTGQFQLPGRTAAVFVLPKSAPANPQAGLHFFGSLAALAGLAALFTWLAKRA